MKTTRRRFARLWLLPLCFGFAALLAPDPAGAACIIKHVFVSPKADSTDTTVVRPSSWNDCHAYAGGTNGQFVVVDTDDATYRTGFTAGLTYVNNQLLLPDGTLALPAVAFSSETNTGLFRVGTIIRIGLAGGLYYSFKTSGLQLHSDSGTLQLGVNGDVVLARDAPNTLAQKQGTNPQTHRIYGTFTDASNYERLAIFPTSTGDVIQTQAAGTGAARTLHFGVGGTNYWQVNLGGHFIAQTDNVTDIGGSGAADRPRSLYVRSRMIAGRATLTYGTSVATNASTANEFVVTATNGTAFTMANPTDAVTGHKITYTIRNTSGGALGTVTWDTLFKLAAWTSPATANSRSISFTYDGTNWVEVTRVTADVPN